jgi:membrane glycosyltransferase
MQPISLQSRLSLNLEMGRRKLEVSAKSAELLNLLKPGERQLYFPARKV